MRSGDSERRARFEAISSFDSIAGVLPALLRLPPRRPWRFCAPPPGSHALVDGIAASPMSCASAAWPVSASGLALASTVRKADGAAAGACAAGHSGGLGNVGSDTRSAGAGSAPSRPGAEDGWPHSGRLSSCFAIGAENGTNPNGGAAESCEPLEPAHRSE